MDQQVILLTIAGMALVTYLPRALPALALSSRTLNPTLTRFLSYIPSAVLAAMLGPGLLIRDGALDLSAGNVFLLAAVPTMVLAVRTKSFFGSVALGMALVAAARLWMG